MAERDYSHVPLTQKLGIRDGSAVALVHDPGTVAALDGVATGASKELDVIVTFATENKRLSKEFAALVGKLADRGGLWVAWPKKTSQLTHDLDFDAVQHTGLSHGLVDNKVCRIDDDWQAVRFVRRRS